MRKFLLLATIVALSSLLKCEAKGFFMFPLRFDYNRDKESDQATKTLTYSSPLSGKTYNVDYTSNFGGWRPPPGPSPFPMGKAFNFDTSWLFNKGHGFLSMPVATTTRRPVPIAFPVHPFLKAWNFNKGMGPGHMFNWDFNWNVNKGQANNGNGNREDATTEAANEKTATMASSGGNGLIHKTVDIKVSYGQSPSDKLEPPRKASQDEKPKSDDFDDDEEEQARDDESGKKSAQGDDDDETDIDPNSSDQ